MSNNDSEGKISRVTQIIGRLQNSRFVAPVIVFGVIVIGLAHFTDAFYKLKQLTGWGNGFAVNGRGPLYSSPRLNGRTIDECILTQTPDDPNNCNTPAQMEIASQYCNVAGYARAVNFETNYFPAFQKSYKLSQVLAPDGELKHVWNKNDRGGAIFTLIRCET